MFLKVSIQLIFSQIKIPDLFDDLPVLCTCTADKHDPKLIVLFCFFIDAQHLLSIMLDPYAKTRATIEDILSHPWMKPVAKKKAHFNFHH